MNNHYAVWKDFRTGTWEVARWVKNPAGGYSGYEVVQSNIPTQEKARAARDLWNRREQVSPADQADQGD